MKSEPGRTRVQDLCRQPGGPFLWYRYVDRPIWQLSYWYTEDSAFKRQLLGKRAIVTLPCVAAATYCADHMLPGNSSNVMWAVSRILSFLLEAPCLESRQKSQTSKPIEISHSVSSAPYLVPSLMKVPSHPAIGWFLTLLWSSSYFFPSHAHNPHGTSDHRRWWLKRRVFVRAGALATKQSCNKFRLRSHHTLQRRSKI